MAEEDLAKTRFNAGVAKLMRIDGIKKQLTVCRVTDDEHSRRRLLGAYRCEINEKLDDDERDECSKWERKIDMLLNSNINFMQFDTNVLDEWLDKYELYLGELEFKYGYSMPDEDEDEGL